MCPLAGRCEERAPRAVRAVHRRHLEVVPRGAVDVHGDGVPAENGADRLRECFEEVVEVALAAARERGDVEQRLQARERKRVELSRVRVWPIRCGSVVQEDQCGGWNVVEGTDR